MKSFILATIGLFLFLNVHAAGPTGTTVTIKVPGIATSVEIDNTWNTITVNCSPDPNQTCYESVTTTGSFIGEYWEVKIAGNTLSEGYLEDYSVSTNNDGSTTHFIDLQ